MLNWTHTDITESEHLIALTDLYMNTIDKGEVIAAAFDTETTGLHHIYDKRICCNFN